MAGVNIDINAGGKIVDCVISDENVSGSGVSSFAHNGELRNTVLSLPGVTTTGITGDIVHSEVTLGDLTFDSAVNITHSGLTVETLTFGGNGAQLHGGYAGFEVSTGNNGITINGHSVSVDSIRLILNSAAANNASDAISVNGDFALLDGLRFTRSGSNTWRYLVAFSTGSTGSVIGNYTFDPAVVGTGETST